MYAEDRDVGKNAEILYTMEKIASPPFRIDSRTGIIFASGSLDREERSYYAFKVTIFHLNQLCFGISFNQ